MTYIEFFDKVATKNVGACLTYVPDRVVFIGDNAKLMKRHIENYQRVFKARGYDIDFSFKTMSQSNLDNAVKLLSELVETYDDCVFDVTGGEEILMLALGIVYARYPEKNIQIHKVNLRSNAIYDYDKDGTTVYHMPPKLSVEENVRIFGGDVVYGAIHEEKTYRWDLNPDFLNDIRLMWDICKGNVRYWNTQIGVFAAADAVGSVSEDGLTTVASRAALEHHLQRRGAKYKKAKGIVACLLKHGLLTCFEDEDGLSMTVTYKNEQVKKCLTKAGQALEMKVYVTAKEMLDEDGVPVYDDALNGVVIDWDGHCHDEETEALYDTENEVDVLLMHDVVPVFVSCKNGAVTSDELYKLDAVAKRFGGQHSKRVLVATALDCMKEAGEYLRQRAMDMNIRVVENIQELDDAALAKKIKSFWCN